MIDCPGVTDVDVMPYEPLLVLVAHWVVEVGTVAEVVIHASVTGAPDGSLTMPVIVIAAFVAVGTGVGVFGSVRTGVGVGVRAGVGVGVWTGVAVDGGDEGSWTAGTPDADGDADGDGELAGVAAADGDAVATTGVSTCGRSGPSAVTADADAARAFAAAPA